jgi:hypothetical protein
MSHRSVVHSPNSLYLFRRWPGRTPSRRFWPKARRKAFYSICEHCGRQLNAHGIGFDSAGELERFGSSGHVDHIVPARYVALHSRKDPNAPVNLMTLAITCHGIKTGADRHLCEGNKARYLEILQANHFPMDRVHVALAYYGL